VYGTHLSLTALKAFKNLRVSRGVIKFVTKFDTLMVCGDHPESTLFSEAEWYLFISDKKSSWSFLEISKVQRKSSQTISFSKRATL